MNGSELLVKLAKENQLLRILLLLEHSIKNGETLEEVLKKVEALLWENK